MIVYLCKQNEITMATTTISITGDAYRKVTVDSKNKKKVIREIKRAVAICAGFYDRNEEMKIIKAYAPKIEGIATSGADIGFHPAPSCHVKFTVTFNA